MSFISVIIGGLAIAASWSQDDIMNYIYGYGSLILMTLFVTTGMSIMILEGKYSALTILTKFCIIGRVVSDFAKECASATGMAHQIDSIYMQGS